MPIPAGSNPLPQVEQGFSIPPAAIPLASPIPGLVQGSEAVADTAVTDGDLLAYSGTTGTLVVSSGIQASDVAALLSAPPAGEAFPVGAVYINVTGTDPGTELGYGTWSAFGAGRVLVGYDSGDTDFDTAEETGGAKTVASAGSVAAPTISGSTASESSHTHTYTQVVNHTHKLKAGTGTTGNFAQLTAAVDTTSGGTGASPTMTNVDTTTQDPTGGVATGTTNAGSSHSHGTGTLAASAPSFTGSATSVVQPYIVVHFWKRTA